MTAQTSPFKCPATEKLPSKQGDTTKVQFAPETMPTSLGLPVSGTSTGGTSRPPVAFWQLLSDAIGAACIFFLLFAGLFLGSLV